MITIIKPVFLFVFFLITACSIDPDDSGNNDDRIDLGKGNSAYTIGGNVTGLVGKRLVLRLNNDNDFIVSSNGPFIFPNSLVLRDEYAVKIIKQPDNPGQRCKTIDGSGRVSGVDIDSIRIECEFIWSKAEDTSDNISPDGTNASDPQVVMNANGDAVVVWVQSDGNYQQIYKSEYRAGIWKLPTSLNDSISIKGYTADHAKVALNDDGDTIITWYQRRDGYAYVLKSEYRNGIWSHPSGFDEHLNILPTEPVNTGNDTLNPEVAMDNNGEAIIVWNQLTSSNIRAIFKAEYRTAENNPETASWRLPTSLTDYISVADSSANSAKVAMGDNGEAVIVWVQSDGNENQIYFSELRGEKWDHPDNLEDNYSPGSTDAGAPQVAMNHRGHTVITWHQKSNSSTGNYFIYRSQYYNKDSDLELEMIWYHPDDLGEVLSLSGTDSKNPMVSVDDSDRAIIVWHDAAINQNIYKSEFSKLSNWPKVETPNQKINLDDTGAFAPSVASSASENAVITWRQKDQNNMLRVYKNQFYSSIQRWVEPESFDDAISLSETGATGLVSAAMSDTGDAILAWSQHDGNNWQIFLSEYRTFSEPTSEFSIGGKVAGYDGTGLQLLNNNIDKLDLAEDGSFTFKSTLQQLNTYDVKIFKQPDGGDQNCIIENASGTVIDSNINNIRIRCNDMVLPMQASSVYNFANIEEGNLTGLTHHGEDRYLIDQNNSQIIKLDKDNNVSVVVSNIAGLASEYNGIQVNNDALYFTAANQSQSSLYKIDLIDTETPLDFADLTAIATSDDWKNPSSVIIDDQGRVYVTSPASNESEGLISLIDVDEDKTQSEFTYTNNKTASITTDGENIYLAASTSIVKINAAGLRNTLDFGFNQLTAIHFANDMLYFADENIVYQYDITTRLRKKLFEFAIDPETSESTKVKGIYSDANDQVFLLGDNQLWQLLKAAN